MPWDISYLTKSKLAALACLGLLMLAGVGCRNQQPVTNPFVSADLVPPPVTRQVVPGTAQPYYSGDPLPPMNGAPLPGQNYQGQNFGTPQTFAPQPGANSPSYGAPIPGASGPPVYGTPYGAPQPQATPYNAPPMYPGGSGSRETPAGRPVQQFAAQSPVSNATSARPLMNDEQTIAIPDDDSALRLVAAQEPISPPVAPALPANQYAQPAQVAMATPPVARSMAPPSTFQTIAPQGVTLPPLSYQPMAQAVAPAAPAIQSPPFAPAPTTATNLPWISGSAPRQLDQQLIATAQPMMPPQVFIPQSYNQPVLTQQAFTEQAITQQSYAQQSYTPAPRIRLPSSPVQNLGTVQTQSLPPLQTMPRQATQQASIIGDGFKAR